MNYVFFIVIWFLIPIKSFPQKKLKEQKRIEKKYNRTDSKGLYQGFWKFPLPDDIGHFSNYQEGVYYNGKKVGVWYKKNYKHTIYEMEIFYDTAQDKVEHFAYYLKSQLVKEHGYYFLTQMGKTDTFNYVDPITNRKKQITWDSTNMKQGKWTYYHENGQIESEGLFTDDRKKEIWKYYNEKGELLKTEDN